MADYTFRRADSSDLDLLNAWILEPEVARWWIDADGLPAPGFDEDYLAEADTRVWIVGLAGCPIAFLQDYDPHAWPGHHFAYLPTGSRGIDQFIGAPKLIGCGHGSRFITQFTNDLLAFGVPAIGTDPHPDNARAIRAYEKAGFVGHGETLTDWGPAILMEKR